jgi:hypothetical protein
MAKKEKDNKSTMPPEAVKEILAVFRSELGDFKAVVKGELVQFSDDLDELREQVGDGRKGEARLLLTKKFFDTDRNEIKEVSRISPMAVESFAEAFTLDAMTSPEVQSGEVSLTALLLDNIFRLNLSARGWGRGLGMPALIEQVGATQVEGEEPMPTVEAGGRR